MRVQRRFLLFVGTILGIPFPDVDDLMRQLCPLEVHRECADLAFLFKLVNATLDCPNLLTMMDFRFARSTKLTELCPSTLPDKLSQVRTCGETTSHWKLRPCWGGLVPVLLANPEIEIRLSSKVLTSCFPLLNLLSLMSLLCCYLHLLNFVSFVRSIIVIRIIVISYSNFLSNVYSILLFTYSISYRNYII